MKVNLFKGIENEMNFLKVEKSETNGWYEMNVNEIGYSAHIKQINNDTLLVFLPDDYGQVYSIKGTLPTVNFKGITDSYDWLFADNVTFIDNVYGNRVDSEQDIRKQLTLVEEFFGGINYENI